MGSTEAALMERGMGTCGKVSKPPGVVVYNTCSCFGPALSTGIIVFCPPQCHQSNAKDGNENRRGKDWEPNLALSFSVVYLCSPISESLSSIAHLFLPAKAESRLPEALGFPESLSLEGMLD